MSFLLFIAVVVLAILLIAKHSPGTPRKDDAYAQGYWDGYRALGKKIQSVINRHPIDKDALQREINAGHGGVESPTGEDSFIEKLTHASVMAPSQEYMEVIPTSPHPTKEQQSTTNLNILLFVASLLFVAAGAAFVATAMPDSVKLFGVWLLVAVFYGAGMTLQHTKKLKPAGTAFIGTSLGLIPFAGIALYQLAHIPGSIAWCLTSLIGLIAYYFAAIRLHSQVVSYLTLAFVVSLASSFAESLSIPVMWNLVLIIGVSLVANLLAQLKPNWIPQIFSEPVERTGQVVTPLTLVASLTLIDQLSLFSYEIVFGVATLHYLVVWLQLRHRAYETVVRVLAHLTLFMVAIDVFDSERVAVGIAFLVLAVLQQVYSLIRYNQTATDRSYEWSWLYSMQTIQLLSPLFWWGTTWDTELTTLAYLLIGAISVLFVLRSRKIHAAIPGFVISLVMPFIVSRWLIEPALDWMIVAVWFTLAAMAIVTFWSVIVRRSSGVQSFFIVVFSSYIGVAAVVSLFCDTDWSRLVLFGIIASLLWCGSYVMKQIMMSVVGCVAFVVATVYGWLFLGLDNTWLALGVAWFASLILYLMYLLLLSYKDTKRALGSLGIVWITLGLGVLTSFFDATMNVAAALTIVVGAATLGIEGYRTKDKRLVEVAVYVATFGLQRTISILWPELNVVFYAHWWALTLAGVAFWRHQLTTRLIVGMSFITASTAMYALGEGDMYQLLFLAEHVGLLIAGVLLQKQWATWWGVIASTLAVLYFLRDIAFLAFAFLGMVVIGIVIWRLTQHGKEAKSIT